MNNINWILKYSNAQVESIATKKIYNIAGFNLTSTLVDVTIGLGSRVSMYPAHLFLLLYPLSSITDEHAIEVAKIAYHVSESTLEGQPVVANHYANKITVRYANDGVMLVISFDGSIVFAEKRLLGVKLVPLLNHTKIIDYLRSNSYDIDGLIEKGIAKEITKPKP